MLLDRNADVQVVSKGKSRGVTPLMLAALSNKPEIVQLLLKAGADANAVSSSNLSVLAHAAIGAHIKRNTASLQVLLASGMKADEAAIQVTKSSLLRFGTGPCPLTTL